MFVTRHRIISIALLAVVAAACGNRKEVEKAKRSLFDADFAVVYQACLEATRELYPSLEDNPGAGAVRTRWHQVSYANTGADSDLSANKTLSTGAGGNTLAQNAGQAGAGMPTRLAYKRTFIRFDVSVVGGRPWRVKVVGHASEWEPGAALPNELKGPARPHWLDGRTDALTLAIWKRIKGHAVPMPEKAPEVKVEDTLPKTDPKSFANVPADAAKRLALLKDAVVLREYDKLRAQVFDDVRWSAGGDPGIETAMAMWQADPETLDQMAKAIGAGCAAGDKKVTCPGTAPVAGQWQLVLEQRGADWKLASFIKVE